MSESKQAGQSFALPTFLAAMMLLGIVAVALQLTIARRPAVPAPAPMATAHAADVAHPTAAAQQPHAAPASPPVAAAAVVPPKAAPAVTPRTRVSIAMPQAMALPEQPPAAFPPPGDARLRAHASDVLPAATPIPAPPPGRPAARPAVPPVSPAPGAAAALSAPSPDRPVTGAKDRTRAVDQVPPAPDAAGRAVPSAPPVPAAWIVVRPGQSLWEIAREHYGRGSDYVAIFRANRDQIANAGLVHPGQRLRLPALSRQTASDTAVVVRPGQSLRHSARGAYRSGGASHASYRASGSRLTTPGMTHHGQVPSPPTGDVATG